jgi:hypothetical protein
LASDIGWVHMRQLGPRDYAILALISVATAITLAGFSEISARALFIELSDSCQATTGIGFVPNCTSLQKVAEGPVVTNHYNECGFRTAESCGPKPGIRVAVLGTSISRGYAVAYDESFGARSSVELTKRCRRPVEFQNLSITWTENFAAWDQFDRRVGEALGLNPDVLLFMLAPWDIWKYHVASSSGQPSISAPRKFERLPFYRFLHSVSEYLRDQREQSRAVLILRHLILEDQDTFVRLYLKNGDESDYLRAPFTDAWRRRLEFVDSLIGRLVQQAGSEHVPVVVAFVPFAAHVLLARSSHGEAGIDPFALDHAIEAMTARYDAQYVDIIEPMSRLSHPAQMYYSVNGHPNGKGNAVIAAAVNSELLKNAAFKDCVAPLGVDNVGVH